MNENQHILPTAFYINRELSWLAFNTRVLEEAFNPYHPLLERLRFLSISASNLDEFYMVRVAGLKGQVTAAITTPSQDGMTPSQQLCAISKTVTTLFQTQQTGLKTLSKALIPEGLERVKPQNLNKDDIEHLTQTFNKSIFPTLTPLAVDSAHPFPFIANRGLVIAVDLYRAFDKHTMIGLIPLPLNLERFIELPQHDTLRFIALEHVIPLFFNKLFPQFTIKGQGVFRILRDSDMEIDEEAEDLVRTFENMLKRRRRGHVIRLELSQDMSPVLKNFITKKLEVDDDVIFTLAEMVGLQDIDQLISPKLRKLQFPPYIPSIPKAITQHQGDCFATMRDGDFIVHHPYESFDVVIHFLEQAAIDPDVVTIKQTLYRTSDNSPIIAALIHAAENGKSVTAVVELKARFDEAANIRWARDLERAGVHVVYGFIDLKTHAKVSIVVRREAEGMRTYTHFGTGNYHPITARVYTDFSFFSCRNDLGRDATRAFNFMTGYASPQNMETLSIAPLTLRKTLMAHIQKERENAKKGKPCGIWLKLNNLVDKDIITALYQASQEGVKIDIIARGICCLRPQVQGLSDNITVKSIVGRFLEHARLYAFANGKALPSSKSKVYISSADLMPRNLNRRVEALIPIENEAISHWLLDPIMKSNLDDEAQSWIMQPNGDYKRILPMGQGFSVHDFFMKNPGMETSSPPKKIKHKSYKRT